MVLKIAQGLERPSLPHPLGDFHVGFWNPGLGVAFPWWAHIWATRVPGFA